MACLDPCIVESSSASAAAAAAQRSSSTIQWSSSTAQQQQHCSGAAEQQQQQQQHHDEAPCDKYGANLEYNSFDKCSARNEAILASHLFPFSRTDHALCDQIEKEAIGLRTYTVSVIGTLEKLFMLGML